MKKFAVKIFIGIFLILCLLPSVGMLITGPSAAGANEIRASAPKLTEDGKLNTAFFSDLADWFSDRYALRQEAITLWSGLNEKLFGISASDDVVLGTDGWLYYADSLDDYTGASNADERTLYVTAHNLSLIREYAESCGAELVFTAAPNKNSLYPEYMPSDIEPGHDTALITQLAAALRSEGVTYADLYTALLQQDETLYYTQDSHWTSKGAALGADTILKALGVSSDRFEDTFTETGRHTGDLYSMLYPAGSGTEPALSPDTGFSFEPAADTFTGEEMTIRTQSDGDGSLLCWRDSFGISLFPYLADAYGSAVFLRESTYNLLHIGEYGADTVVIELVERNLNRLAADCAVYPALIREITPDGNSARKTDITVSAGTATDQLLRISGTLPETPDVDSPVYIRIDGTWYEAQLISDGEEQGFAAWVPASEADAIAYKRDGRLIACGVGTVTVEASDAEAVSGYAQKEASYEDACTMIGRSTEDLYELIGAPQSTNYVSSCLGPGDDGELTYDGFIVTTYRYEGSETVESVYRTSDQLYGGGGSSHYTVGDDQIDDLIDEVFAGILTDDMTQDEKLRAAFDYCVDNFEYLTRDHYRYDADWLNEAALVMLRTHKGNCYNFAAAFCCMAKALGFDAKGVIGRVAPGTDHAWVVVTVDGQELICDCEMQYVSKGSDEAVNMYMMTAEAAQKWDYTPDTEELVQQREALNAAAEKNSDY